MKKSKVLSLLLTLVMLFAVAVTAVGCKEDLACEHTYGAWMLTEAPTENEAGTAVRICSKCTFAETQTVAALSDATVWTAERTEPTYTEKGKIVYTSAFGTVTVDLDKLEAAACEHTYGSWQLTKAPTETETGTAVRVCSKCNVAESVAVPVLTDEAWTAERTEPTYTEKGKIVYTSDFGTVTVTLDKLEAAACEHTYGSWQLTKAPTETETGTAVRVCSECNEAESVAVPVLTDEAWTAETTPATHLAEGQTVYTSAYGTVTVTIAKIAEHTFDQEVVDARYLKSAADCHHAAEYYKTCACGAVGTETFTSGEALAHVEEEIPAVPATCSATGLTAGSKCAVCGEILEAQQPTDKIAHTFGSWQLTKAPTEDETGTAIRVCSVCNEAETKTDVPVLTDSVWTVDRLEPTTSTEGRVVYTSVYGSVKIVLEKLPEDNTCQHEYGNWIITEAPGADTTGRAVKICSKCAVSQAEIVEKLTDTSVWTAVTTPATHLAEGQTVYTSVYGTVTVTIPKIAEHTFEEVVDARYLKSAADCHHAAEYYKTCACGVVGNETFTYGDPLSHVEEVLPAVEATCYSTGLTEGKKCSVCGEILEAQQTTDKIAHTFGSWQLTKAPTETETGTAIRVCSVCNEAQTKTDVPVLTDGSWEKKVTPSSHLAEGQIVYTSKYGTVTVIIPKIAGHRFDQEVVDERYLKSAADCHHAAEYYKTCACGAVGTETFMYGEPLSHVEEVIPAVEATCSSTGLTEGKKCALCGEILVAQQTTEKIAHTVVTDPAHPATCTHEGVTEGKHCSVCGEVLVAQGTIPVADHIPGAAATCTTDQTCVVCGAVIEAAHHTWKLVDGLEEGADPVYEYKCVVTGSAEEGTLAETEYHARYCAICGEFDKDTKVAHTYGEEYVVVSKDVNGHDTAVKKACTVCGHETTVKDTLGYLEYSWTKGETVAATYNEAGYTVYTYGTYTYRMAIDKLVAPYDGKTYSAADFDASNGSNRVLSPYIWASATVTLDANGRGVGTASPFRGEVAVTMVDPATGEVSVSIGSNSYAGYVDMETGVIIYGTDDSFTHVYILSPFGAIASSDIGASAFLYDEVKDAMAIDYAYVCNMNATHHTTAFIRDGKVVFGVTFTAENGSFVAAKDCYQTSFTATKIDFSETYVYDAATAKMYTADGMQGTYTASFGTVTLSGYGTLTTGENGGTYAVEGDKIALTLTNAEGAIVAYYEGSFDTAAKTLTVTQPTATVTFTVGEGSDDVIEAQTVNVNVPTALPVPTAKASNWSFVGWYTESTFTEESKVGTTFTATSTDSVTLYAKWDVKITVYIHDAVVGDTTVETVPGVVYGTLLPNYESGKTFNGMHVFEGFYMDEGFEDPFDVEEVTTKDESEVHVYVNYTAAGSWNIVQGSTTFNYNAVSGMWESNNQGKSSNTATLDITAVGGPIHITFKLYANSEGASWDYAYFYYDEFNYETGEWKSSRTQSAKVGGKTTTVADAVTCDLIIPYDAANPDKGVTISYRKDSSGNGGTDTAYIVDLTINGIKVVNLAGSQDAIGGTYTADGKDDLVLNGFGSFTAGETTGVYEAAAEEAGYDAIARTAGGNVYKITLSGSTYTMEEFHTTLTYCYLDGVSADAIETYWYGASVGTVKEMDKTVEGKVFAGWFTANGTETGEWGTELTADMVMNADCVVYAKWITPHELMGEHHGMGTWGSTTAGANTYFGGTSDYTFVVDAYGAISGRYTASAFDTYDAETGKFTFTSGGDTYYGHYDKVNGVIAICEATSGFTYSYIDIFVVGATSAKLTSTSGDGCTGCYWNGGKIKLITLPYTKDGVSDEINVFVYGDKVYGNVTWTSTDGEVGVRDAYAANQLTVKDSDGVEIVSFVKSASSGLQIPDGTEGTYTAESGETVVLNGAGVITIDGVAGTYTAASASADYGYDVKTETMSYKLTIDQEANTCVLVAKALTATFVNDKVTVENMTVYAGVKFTLPSSEDMAVEGFIFRGWYKNEGFTGSTYTTDTITADDTYYAKYDAAVTLTFDYNGQGTEAVVVPDKYVGDKVSGIPTVDSSVVTADGKVFAGWYSKNGTETGDWGEVASTSTVLSETTVTYYAKWVTPNPLYGSWKGYNVYGNVTVQGSKTLTVSVLGAGSGSVTRDLTACTGTGYFLAVNGSSKYYSYADLAQGCVIIPYSSSETSFGSDVFYFFKDATTVSCAKTDVFSWNSNKSRLIKFTVDGNTVNIYINDNEVYVGVSVVDSTGTGVEISSTMVTEGSVITIKDAALQPIVTLGYQGGTFVPSDGTNGTYTADDAYGDIVMDGYGNLTVNGTTAAYTLDGNQVSFVVDGKVQRVITIDVAAKTYVKTLDGYEGTYTLPDGATTVTLDGYGNAGEGVTYVVTGNNIALYTAETEETAKYGIDVEAKAFLAKSVFAGYTFTGSYYDEYNGTSSIKLVFDDSSEITVKLTLGTSFWFDFTATFDAETNTLTMTVTNAFTSGFTGNMITATLSGNTLTFVTAEIKRTYGSEDAYDIVGATATCADFSL